MDRSSPTQARPDERAATDRIMTRMPSEQEPRSARARVLSGPGPVTWIGFTAALTVALGVDSLTTFILVPAWAVAIAVAVAITFLLLAEMGNLF